MAAAAKTTQQTRNRGAVYLIAFFHKGRHVAYGSDDPRGKALHYLGWAQERARVVGAHAQKDGKPVPGAATLALLDAGGPGSLQGFLTAAKVSIYNQQQAFTAYLRERVANGLVQNNPQWPRSRG
jgi:hypothetical protein